MFREQYRRKRERRPDETPGKYQPQLDGFKRRETSTERDRNSGPGLGGRRWELVGAERLRVWQDRNGSARDALTF
jgi:hypothetical protein